MTYDEACNKFFDRIAKYCIHNTSKDRTYAEDTAVEVFVLLKNKWDELKSHEENAILVWLYSAANKMLHQTYRSIKKELSVTVFLSDLEPTGFEIPDESIDGYDENRKFEKYLSDIRARLEGSDLELFDLKVVHKKRYSEIAKELQISESAVKMRYMRLRRNIKEMLGDIIER
jgi:RNA polymerase sigma-70 factor (ECF subfamily)